MNYTEILSHPKSISKAVITAVGVLIASWLIAISAQTAVQLPFSPIPITGQTLAVLLTGMILGKRKGTAAVILYLLQGAAGIPVFAGGKSGIAALFGPTGGYLVGFLAAVYVVGMLSELRENKSPLYSTLVLIIGNVVIYMFGLIWLVKFVGESQALQLGMLPFLVGDGLKIILGVLVLAGSKLIIPGLPTRDY